MRAVLLGALLGVTIGACMAAPRTKPVPREDPRELADKLWLQIRDWRHEAGWRVDPPVVLQRQFPASVSVEVAKKVCVKKQPEPPTCSDTCVLANSICDNAELICKIADELGKDDPTQEKCTSAKASCREAEQRCCDCHANPPAAAEILPPAPSAGEAAP